ncbi:MAG: GNAT family N-acetyltransferase [Acidimicrobiales bacterium]
MTPDPQIVHRAETSDRKELAAVLGRAFQTDPVWNWLFPDPATKLRRSTQVFQAYLRDALTVGEVYTTPDRAGAALWKPPGKWKLGNAAIVRSLPSLLRAFGTRLPASLEIERKVEAQHPLQPHWYLSVIGTDPVAQGRGVGNALIRQVTDRCDQEGLPAYLESSKAENVPYYQRYGFKVTGETVLGDDGPTIWFMWRDPQVPDSA